MHNLTNVPAKRLADRHERGCARLARIATSDTINGGARALRIAARLERMGSPIPGDEIVSSVYSASTGRADPTWSAFECPECGSAHMGVDAALQCCAPTEDDYDDYLDDDAAL